MGYIDKVIEELKSQVRKTSEEEIRIAEHIIKERNKGVNEFIEFIQIEDKQLEENLLYADEYNKIENLTNKQRLISAVEEVVDYYS